MVARASYLCCELNWTQQAKIFYNFFYFLSLLVRCMWPLGEEVEELWCGLPTSQETSGSFRGFLLSEVTVTP